jgi:hypothetical protein
LEAPFDVSAYQVAPNPPVINIGKKQRWTRKVLGVALIIGGLVVGLLDGNTAGGIASLLLIFGLFYVGSLCLFEVFFGVCPANALQGKQSMHGYFSAGQEKVNDPFLVRAARKVAVKEGWLALISAAILTIPFFWV